jgi:drug/metabolite transporter (DMT)-like permease
MEYGKGVEMRVRTRRLALTEGIVAGVSFGTAAICIRFMQNLDAFSIAFWRLVIAAVALIVILVVLRKSFSFDLVRKNLKELFFISFFLGLHFIFFVSAVKDTTILNATVLVNTSPIFSMFVSSLLFKLKPSRIAIIGLAISFIGVCLIGYAESVSFNTVSGQLGYSPSLKGDVEAVLAALVEAFYLNYGRKIRSQMNVLPTMIPTYLLTAAVVAAISLPATSKALQFPAGMETLLPLVGLGIIPTALAHTLYFSSLSNLKSFETATMALLEPIGATILGISLFQEVPAPSFAVGAAFVLLGILFVIRDKG